MVNTNSVSSSSDEFEDAADELRPLPYLATSPGVVPKSLLRLNEDECDNKKQINGIVSRSSEPSHIQPSTSDYVNLTPPTCLTPQLGKDSVTGSRRGRLSVLRGRMQREFGGVSQISSNALDEDAGSTSESASLASRGRNLIMENSSLTAALIYPTDFMSTKAFPAGGGSAHDSLSLKCVSVVENQAPQVPSRSIADATFKPPARPPPPLPSSPCPPPIPVQLPPSNSTPPPLPPRSTAFRLPPSLPPQTSVILESSSMNLVGQQSSKLSEQENSSISNDSMASMNYARCRGHAKTNSLDRGLSLAKCLKTGPFPPPANKSNSLKREYSTEAADASSFLSLDDGEEELRNSDAQGVIRQITSSLLKEDTFKEDASSAAITLAGGDGRLSAVEEVSLTPLPTPTSSCISKVETESVFVPSANCTEPIVDDKNTDAGISIHKEDLGEDVVANSAKVKEDVDTVRNNKAHHHVGIDPISRDLERRMSIKGHQQSSNQDDGCSGSAPSTISSIGRAAHIVKEYGTLASSILRDAVTKAKNAVTSSNTGSKLPNEYEEENASELKESEIPIVRPKSAKRGPFDFEGTRLVQELNNEHTGAVWCMKFSLCGRLLATAGQDNIVRVWVLRKHLVYFNSMRERYNAQCKQNTNIPIGDGILRNAMQQIEKDFRSSSTTLRDSAGSGCSHDDDSDSSDCSVMAAKPLCTYRGHTADVLDLSWSRSYFILSSGMDRTVKLWHLSRPECLCCFQHMDFVTCVAFMPKDDRFFLSGSLDGKLRLWHIPEKKVALWNELEHVKFITAIAFVKNGRFAVVGTYDGRCFFYSTDQLKYHTVIDVRSSRGKNARGHKVTGLSVHGDKLLVTSNDSRIRMYDLRDMALTCKLKGAQIERSQIPAAFSPDGKHIVCGSEDHDIYIWSTGDLPSSLSVRKDRNDAWQRIRCHTACVSAAIFAPRPLLFFSLHEQRRGTEEKKHETSGHTKSHERQIQGDVIISADLQGSIKILANRTPIKAGSSNFFAAGIV